ncbi:amino acid adenylation domain-containing protein [Streptomyces atratus]
MPASPAQVGLWLLVELDPTSTAYNVPAAMRLSGPLDVDALARALRGLCERHEILRTTFTVADGEVSQVIHPESRIGMDQLDLTGLGGDTEAVCRKECAERAAESFDLENGPLLRVVVFRLDQDDHVVSLLMHHIITDGWSMGVFIKELAVLYMAELVGAGDAPLPPPALQYADFAVWHRGWLGSGVQDAQLGYWRGVLADEDLVLELPTDRARPRVPTFAGDRVSTTLDAELGQRLRAMAARLGATPFMATHAAFAAVLARNASQGQIRIGVPSANRDHANTQELVGFFANTLVVGTDYDRSQSFGELLVQVRERTAEALAHGDVPFGEVVRALGGRRDRSRSPLFQAMVAMDNAPGGFDLAPGLRAHRFDVPLPGAKFDLTLFVHDGPAGLELGLEYAADLFTRDTAARLMDQMLAVLRAGTDAPERPLSCLLTVSDEQRRLLADWARGPAVVPDAGGATTALDLFARQVAAAPHAPAIVAGDGTVSYAELDALADRIAAGLAAAGVEPTDRVGVAVPRSVELVAALIAVWKRGAAYVPLDPAQPAVRLVSIVVDARPTVVLQTDGHGTAAAGGAQVFDVRKLLAGDSGAAPAPAVSGSDPAYVLYTSGSTGRPKGVQITQSGLVNYLRWAAAEYCPDEPPVAPLHTTVGFDLTVTSLWVPLTTGGSVHLVDESSPVDGLVDVLSGPARPSLVKLTPAHLEAVCRLLPQGALAGLRVCFVVGGEALAPSLVRRLFAVAPDARVVNEYGPTETVVGCCVASAVATDDLGERPGMSIGRPVANTQLYVVDELLEPVPVGVPGELVVGGVGVGRGYLGDPARTAATFVPDPFSGVPGARLYRTGDVVRYLPDGQLEFLGRRDHQVKIRGQRIELGEVEAALRGVDGVSDAVVVAAPDHLGQTRLAGYVAGGVDAMDVRTAVASALPDAMVPSAVVVLDALPLTPNGKVDRAALPAPEFADHSAYIAPESGTQRQVAAVFAEVLGVERVGLEDDFFALGGHSLLATQLMARIREHFRIDLPLRALFERPVVRGLAELVDTAQEVSGTVPLVRVERSGPVEVSYAQQRMWFLHQLEPDSASYNVPAVVRLRGPLDADRLRAALDTVAQRHEVLRTVFAEVDGRPVQVIGDAPLIDFTVRDLRYTEEPHAAAERLAADLAARPFDLECGPLSRWVLARVGDEEFVLALSMHHIVSDGWSVGVLLHEVQAAYSGTPLPELPIQYADFAAWQRRWLASGVLEEQLTYWRTTLAGAPPVLDLPTDYPRPAIPTYRGAHLHTRIGAETAEALNALAQQHGTTLFMVLQAVYAALLTRRAGQNEIVIGVPVANRSRTETESLIGFFVNTLPLRTQTDPHEPFAVLLDRVRDTALDGFAHQDVPFERLVEELAPDRDLARNPLFQAMLVLQNAPQGAMRGLADVAMERLPLEEGMAKFDFTLLVEEPQDDPSLRIVLEYATDLFAEGTGRAILDGFVLACEVLAREGVATAVGELTVVSPQERRLLLEAWNATDRPEQLGGIVERVRTLAGAKPDALAIRDAYGTVTYGELVARADRLSVRLAEHGVSGGDRVVLFLDRGVDAVTAVLGVLGAGAAYVPLDTGAPRARSADILADSGARILLTGSEGEPLARQLTECVERPIDVLVVDGTAAAVSGMSGNGLSAPLGGPEDLAYVIYTSGSTGRPKGAMVERLGMDNHLLAKVEDLELTDSDVVAQNAALTFDISVWQMLSALAVGGTTVVFDDDIALDATGLFDRCTSAGVTILEVVPSLLRAALDAWDTLGSAPGLPSLRWLVVTGEALPPDLCARWLACYPHIPLMNAYGPTECSDDVTHAVITPTTSITHARAPIGHAIRNTQLYVVDELLEPVPVGVPGELVVGGVGVGRGYLGDPARTAATFVPDPFSGVPGARLYRTGDVVRYLPDGQLEFLGRRDHQVKIRGQRIELGEVEAALRGVDGVSDAVVVAAPDHLGQTRLAGYVAGGVDAMDVRTAVASALPDAMVPSAVVVLDALPLTPNGKVDRAALPAPEFADHSAYIAPESGTQRQVAAVFAEVLGVERVGLEDDFFALGGHSLLATQLMARIREHFRIDLPLRALFERPVVRGLAELVDTAQEVSGTVPLVRVERSGPVEVSYAQQRMWFLHQLEPDSASYNVPAVVRLRGPLDADRLRAALDTVAQRHEVLRTVFAEVDGRPVQVIGDAPLIDFTVTVPDESGDAQKAAERLSAALTARPFDLERGPLLRWMLTWLGDDDHVLALSMHHIVSDGWSVGVLLHEVQAAYAGISLPELPVQYADFAAWQRQWLASGVLEEQLTYWHTTLAGAPPVLDLPTDFPRPAIPTYRGAHLHTRIGAGTAGALNALAQQHGATLFMILQAVYAALLTRRAGQSDVVIGVPIANRSRTETENLIGFFVNTLPLRTQTDPHEPFAALLDRVRDTALDAFAHQDVPFERLVEELAPDRDLARNPLFQAMFVLQNATRTGVDMDGVEVTHLSVEDGTAKFDLMMLVDEAGAELDVALEYATDLFSEGTGRAILDGFVRACEVLAQHGAATAVGELTVVSSPERRLLLEEWIATDRPERLGGIVERVRALAEAVPDALAVQDERMTVTYGELVARADRLSVRLAEHGVSGGDRVVLFLDRGVDAVTAVLGVLGAGAAYVPLDTGAPRARSADILADSGARILLTGSEGEPLARQLTECVERPIDVLVVDGTAAAVSGMSGNGLSAPLGGPEDLAYVIYTSGSTGRPKGAMVERLGMDNHLLAKVEDLELTDSDVVAQNAALTFDISVWQMLSALAVGGTTVVFDDDIALDATGLFDRCTSAGVTILEVVPSLLRAALDAWDTLGSAPGLPSLRWLVVTGEALPPDLCARWLACYPHIPLMNAYGPTECSDDVTHAVITPTTSITHARAPIGHAIRNTQLYVVDELLEPVPVGVPGELVVGGVGVGRGYLGDPARTAATFVPDPFSGVPGARLYRTGDVVRYLPDGQLEFLGRRDHQVKIRGQRIELGEVEAALRGVDGVSDAVVVAAPDHLGQTRLAGYVAGGVDAMDVRTAVASALPDAMVPSAVVVLDALPLTPNGKVDRAALPAPEFADHSAYIAPSTVQEHRLAMLFAEVLGVERVGLEDDFFALGGHSLLATQLMARIREHFRIDLPLRALFEHSGLRDLAAVVARAEAEQATDSDVSELEQLLYEIEGLSDVEIEERLARGDGPLTA